MERGIDRLGHGHRPCRPFGHDVLADRPDLVGFEMSRRLAVGPLHGVKLLHDVGRNPVKAVADGVVPSWKGLGLDLGNRSGDQV